MVEVTVLIPTQDHADTLFHSVASVQAQTVTDFELFIVGDGVPPRSREVVGELMDKDSRIRFFDNPKGPRHGEVHRHAALQHASGKFICYQCDDDLWLRHHLKTMCGLLGTADLAHTRCISVNRNERIFRSRRFDVGNPHHVALMRRKKFGFGLQSGGHRLDAYHRLPFGWRTTPADFNTDYYMWLQFLDQPWCRAVGSRRITAIHFSSRRRMDWTLQQRLAEIDCWTPKIPEPTIEWQLYRSTLQKQLRHWRSQALRRSWELVRESGRKLLMLNR